MTNEEREAVALFRYGLISEFLDGRTTRGERRCRMRELASRRYDVSWQAEPYEVSIRMLSRWLGSYRRHGYDGLKPAVRRDRGTCKAIDIHLQNRIIAVKTATPSLAIPQIIHCLEEEGEVQSGQLARSTVHRLLKHHGLSRRSNCGAPRRQRLPFRYEYPFDLWVGDVMHGRVEVAGRKVYLIAYLDNATRAIMHAAFRFSEGALDNLEVFREALLVRGVPKRVYLDHGSAFVDSRFMRTCAHLGIHCLYAPVADGASKGAIERWFGRVRRQFERYLRAGDLTDLETLNSILWNWIHSSYHDVPHHGLDGETPWSRYMRLLGEVEHRRVEEGFDFWTLWRTRDTRVVRNDGTVSLMGHCLEVPPTIPPRTRVELRFIEESLPEDVEVWLDDEKLGVADIVRLEENAKRRRWQPREPKLPAEPLPLDPLGKARSTWKAGKGQ